MAAVIAFSLLILCVALAVSWERVDHERDLRAQVHKLQEDVRALQERLDGQPDTFGKS